MVENPIRAHTMWIEVAAGFAVASLTAAIFFGLILPRLLILRNATSAGNADYIAVLDGHDDNYYEGLRLLREGAAPKMFVCLDLPDVPPSRHEIEQNVAFVQRTAGALANAIDICKNDEKDPYTELLDLLPESSSRRVIIVTPGSESRVQYTVATRLYPDVSWAVHPSPDHNFNVRWWRRRDWAETYVNSIGKLANAMRVQAAPKDAVQSSSR